MDGYAAGGDRKYRIVAADDIREEVYDFVVKRGGAKILAMQVKEPSLEEIFLEMVG